MYGMLFAASTVCRHYKPCEFLGFVWTDYWVNYTCIVQLGNYVSSKLLDSGLTTWYSVGIFFLEWQERIEQMLVYLSIIWYFYFKRVPRSMNQHCFTHGPSILCNLHSQECTTFRYLKVPRHGSPNTLFEAFTVQDAFPSQLPRTFSRAVSEPLHILSCPDGLSLPLAYFVHTSSLSRPYRARCILRTWSAGHSSVRSLCSHARLSTEIN